MIAKIKIPNKTRAKWEAGLLTITEARTEAAREYIAENLTGYEKSRNEKIAARLIDVLDTYELQDTGETVESIARTITTSPESIIIFLLDLIEND